MIDIPLWFAQQVISMYQLPQMAGIVYFIHL